jgi:putative tricarboxylic transport membrane protein
MRRLGSGAGCGARAPASHRAEDAFRLSMIGSGGSVSVFWSNGLVGTITTIAVALLFWPVIDRAFAGVGRLMRPTRAMG